MNRRARFRPSAPLPQWVTLLILAGVAAWWVWEELQKSPVDTAPGPAHTARCVKVIDGDTLDIKWPNGKRERVRVLGIDCMESHNEDKRAQQARRLGVEESFLVRMSKQATQMTTSSLLNQPVSLVFPQERSAYDPYNRLLCYVEYEGQDLGALLLEQGLAEARREPHPRKSHYQDLDRTARAKRVGIYQ